MSDNVTSPGVGGPTFASDDIGGVQHPRTKLEWGPDGTANETDDATGKRLPVKIGEALPAGTNNIGDVDVASLPPVDVATLPAVTGTVAVSTLPALTAGSAKIGGVDLDSDATPGAAVPAVAQLVAGTDGTNARSLKTDAAGELQVDVLTIPNVTIGAALPAGTANIGDVDVLTLPALPAGTNNIGDVDVVTLPGVAGDVAHDGVDSGNPVKQGAKAVAHGANPAAVAAADRSDLLCNRHGIPFSIGGHPNIVTLTNEYTGAQTDVALVTVSTGTKIVVVGYMVACSKANTVNVLAKIGFGTANVPASGAGVIGWHPGIDPGGGFARGNGAGILGIGADNEDLRFTCGAPTTGSVTVSVQYFTIES